MSSTTPLTMPTPLPCTSPVERSSDKRGKPTSPMEFVTLNRDVFVHRPPESAVLSGRRSSVRSPRVILLFGYMGASTTIMEKHFMRAYGPIYPDATIVAVKILRSFLFRGIKDRETNLEPVVDLLMKEIYDERRVDNRPNGLLVHILSNGGAIQFSTLAGMVERRLALRLPLNSICAPPILLKPIPMALVLDSLPSLDEFSCFVSFRVLIKNPVLQQLSRFPIAVSLTSALLVYSALGMDWPVTEFNERIVRSDLFPLPGVDEMTPRTYIYSEGDRQTDWKAVEKHMSMLRTDEAASPQDAERDSSGVGGSESAQGNRMPYNVRVEKFVKSDHVAHMKSDPKRYWNAVRDTWEEAVRKADRDGARLRARL